MLKHLFNEKKAAQAAAYFLFKAQSPLTVLKLMKLLYLAERRSFEQYGEPMIGDRLVSMPHGPVLSMTYNHMNGELLSVHGGWETWVSAKDGHNLALRVALNSPDEQLLELSDADVLTLDEIWNKFGHLTASQLRAYTHKNCAEWKDPDGSMIPIDLPDLLLALNFPSDQIEHVVKRLAEQDAVAAAFHSA